MATYAEQAVVAESPAFISRVQMGMINHAQFQVLQGNDAFGLVTLGKQILQDIDGYAPKFTDVVVTQPIVQEGISASPSDGADVTDLQILSAVETVYPSFVPIR